MNRLQFLFAQETFWEFKRNITIFQSQIMTRKNDQVCHQVPTTQTKLYANFGTNRLITLVYTRFLVQFRKNMARFQSPKMA